MDLLFSSLFPLAPWQIWLYRRIFPNFIILRSYGDLKWRYHYIFYGFIKSWGRFKSNQLSLCRWWCLSVVGFMPCPITPKLPLSLSLLDGTISFSWTPFLILLRNGCCMSRPCLTVKSIHALLASLSGSKGLYVVAWFFNVKRVWRLCFVEHSCLCDVCWFAFQIERDRKRKEDGKRARAEKDEVMEKLFSAFEKHQYYTRKDLVHITQQPYVRIACIVFSIWT